MKQALTIGLAAAVLAATLSLVAADTAKRDRAADDGALPAYEIAASVRALGFNPIGEPIRRGPYYVMQAYDPRGIEVRVVADAHFGEVLSAVPIGAFASAYAPSYQRGPRIIHVPRPAEHSSVRGNDNEADLTGGEDDEVVAPAPRRRVTKQPPARIDAVPPKPASGPRLKPRSDAPPPPPPPSGPRRAVLSAPPPATMGPAIQSAPQNDSQKGSKAEAADKFGSPGDTTAATPAPPPAAVPQAD